MTNEPKGLDKIHFGWTVAVCVTATAVAFATAHFHYGNIWFGFVIVLLEMLAAAMAVGLDLMWKYFFD